MMERSFVLFFVIVTSLHICTKVEVLASSTPSASTINDQQSSEELMTLLLLGGVAIGAACIGVCGAIVAAKLCRRRKRKRKEINLQTLRWPSQRATNSHTSRNSLHTSAMSGRSGQASNRASRYDGQNAPPNVSKSPVARLKLSRKNSRSHSGASRRSRKNTLNQVQQQGSGTHLTPHSFEAQPPPLMQSSSQYGCVPPAKYNTIQVSPQYNTTPLPQYGNIPPLNPNYTSNGQVPPPQYNSIPPPCPQREQDEQIAGNSQRSVQNAMQLISKDELLNVRERLQSSNQQIPQQGGASNQKLPFGQQSRNPSNQKLPIQQQQGGVSNQKLPFQQQQQGGFSNQKLPFQQQSRGQRNQKLPFGQQNRNPSDQQLPVQQQNRGQSNQKLPFGQQSRNPSNQQLPVQQQHRGQSNQKLPFGQQQNRGQSNQKFPFGQQSRNPSNQMIPIPNQQILIPHQNRGHSNQKLPHSQQSRGPLRGNSNQKLPPAKKPHHVNSKSNLNLHQQDTQQDTQDTQDTQTPVENKLNSSTLVEVGTKESNLDHVTKDRPKIAGKRRPPQRKARTKK